MKRETKEREEVRQRGRKWEVIERRMEERYMMTDISSLGKHMRMFIA
jgi:hypothetical protein